MTALPLPIHRDPSPPAAAHAARVLDIAAIGLDPRDRAVLISMCRLLDGRAGMKLRWVEDPAACTTLFVRHDWTQYIAPPRVLVRVTPRGATPAESPRGLVVDIPMRVNSVTEVFEAAAALCDVSRSAAQPQHAPDALQTLHALLVSALLAGERRRTLLGIGGAHGLIVDFRSGEVLSSLPQAELLRHPLQLAEPLRATPEVPWPGESHSLRLSKLLWALSHALVERAIAPRAIAGRYRLRRWPDSAALARPHAPRLVAAWTRRPMTVAEAAAAGALSVSEAAWFLTTALALGIAAPAADIAPEASTPAPAPAEPRGLLERLRSRFKLW